MRAAVLAWQPGRLRLARVLFVLTVAYAGAVFWLAHYPPMIDLPQHAGQIAALRELLLGTSPWGDVLRINLYTPYLIGYGLGLLLSFFMPVTAALKLLLSASCYAFVAMCIALRARFGADERLDWLFIPSFFGLAYKWGFLTFLVAAPVGLAFIWVARSYQERPQMRNGMVLTLFGVALFFCHGLLFLAAAAIGAAFLIADGFFRRRGWRHVAVALLPYFALAAVFLVYFAIDRVEERAMAAHPAPLLWGYDLHRLFGLAVFIFGNSGDWRLAPFALIMLAVPWLLGCRLNAAASCAWVPLAVVLAMWAVVPQFALGTAWMYERFGMFLLPFYALLFRRGERVAPARRRDRRPAPAVVQGLAALVCWALLALESDRIAAFDRETRDFDAVMEAAAPGQRALSLMFDPASRAARDSREYGHFPLWYQADKGGLVDMNFAWYPPQVVRFRPDRLPAVELGFEWNPRSFDWTRHHGRTYRYFFVRGGPLPPAVIRNGECPVALLKSSGPWSLYERGACDPAK